MTIKAFLGERLDGKLKEILKNNKMEGVNIKDFFKKFGEMSTDEMANFLENEGNAYEIGKFAFHSYYEGRDWIGYGHRRISYDLTEMMY